MIPIFLISSSQVLFILIALIIVFLLWLVYVYNSLIVLNKRTDEAWSDIEVQLKRRHDLIPNLVETVKGYAKHEQTLFEKVARLRSEAISAKTPKEAQASENALSAALKTIFAVAEAYPELKASENFKELQRELTDTEDKIEASRRFYNSCVRDLNISIAVFPRNIIANLLGIKEREFFEIETPAEKEPVKVEF